MASKVYVQKPGKVHAEQFLTATLPWPPAVCTQAAPLGICAITPLYPDWRPHVHGEGRVWALQNSDWITTSVAFTDQLPEVLTNPQFEELYGPQPGGTA
jgi:hypothetical protein